MGVTKTSALSQKILTGFCEEEKTEISFYRKKIELHPVTRESASFQTAFARQTGPGEKKSEHLRLFFGRSNQVARPQHAAGGDPDDGHLLLQRRRHRGVDRGGLQQAVQREEGEPERLHSESHVFRLTQVHGLRGCSTAAQAGPRGGGVLGQPQAGPQVLDRGSVQRLAGGDGWRSADGREICQSELDLGPRDESSFPSSWWQRAV